MGSIDLAYGRELLARINRIKVNGTELRGLTGLGGYNLWQWCQQSLFGEIKEFTRTRKARSGEAGRPGPRLRFFAYGLLMTALSLVSLCLLSLSRRKILVYAVDRSAGKYRSDPRLEGVYDGLKAAPARFMEVFHSYPRKDFLARAGERRRWALYLEAIDFVYAVSRRLRRVRPFENDAVRALPLDGFSEEEREFVRRVLPRYLRAVDLSRVRVVALTWILRHTNVRALMAIDDTRHTNELLLACRRASIRTYAFQHGHFTKYHVGWLRDPAFPGSFVAPDRLFVWSRYWKEELLSLGTYFPEESIVVGGAKAPAAAVATAPGRAPGRGVTVLIPFETDAPHREVADYVREMVRCPAVSVILKLRPDVPPEEQLRQYGFDRSWGVATVTDNSQALRITDLVAGTYSTFLYDMVLEGKPVCLFKTSLDYGESMVVNGLASRLDRDAPDLCGQIRAAVDTPTESLEARRQRLQGPSAARLPDTVRALASEIESSNERPRRTAPT